MLNDATNVIKQADALRQAASNAPLSREQIVDALSRLMALWQARASGSYWRPPDSPSAFPWEMVRVSARGFTPPPNPCRASASDLPEAERGSSNLGTAIATGKGWNRNAAFIYQTPPPRSGEGEGGRGNGRLVALICAGNTPLLAWPALCAALLAGASVYVKMSRDETLWPGLFVQSLHEVNASALAARIHLDVWPGDAPKTVALVQTADAVIAYGSDASIAALRAATPQATPFFGFGHAVSVGLWTARAEGEAASDFNDWLPAFASNADGFARDVLMYGQGGCLSPHTIFVEQSESDDFVPAVCEVVQNAMAGAAENLRVPPVTDAAVARALREARDMAHFDGHSVWVSDANPHHGMIIGCAHEQEMLPPVGHGVVFVIPIAAARKLPERFGAARGRVSSVGVAGPLTDELKAVLRAEGVSRICRAGEMQAPPFGWPNGNVDLFSALPAALHRNSQ